MAVNGIDANANEFDPQASGQQTKASVKMEELTHYAAKLGQSSGPSTQYNASMSTADGSSYEFEDISDVYY
jgi:hypothetical protein